MQIASGQVFTRFPLARDLVTQSGTNHWHGTLSEFNRVSAEAANDYFNNLSGQPRAQLTRNQYGGSVGGPIIGGWATSGIVSFHSGYPWSTVTASFPINFTQVSGAVLTGPSSAVKEHIHVETNPATGTPGLQFFADQTNAISAFVYPFGGATGERNTLRGPRYANVDMALLKIFKLPWEGRTLQFRAEAFNAFNHPSFNTPSVNPGAIGSLDTNNNSIDNPLQYGFLTSTANNAREMSLGLLLRF